MTAPRLIGAAFAGVWTGIIAAGVLLTAADCRPELETVHSASGAVALGLGLLAAGYVFRGRAPGEAPVRAATVGGGTSATLIFALTIAATRSAHRLCVRVGHWAPGHVHPARDPAGDVGELLVMLSLWGAALAGVVMAALLLVLAWWVRRRARQRAAAGAP